jgi:hypothetical protein
VNNVSGGNFGVGLFGHFSSNGYDGKVSDLRLDNVEIGTITSSSIVGALAGMMSGGAEIVNCHVTGTVTTPPDEMGERIGGLIGHNASGTITNSSFSGEVSSSCREIGGLVGYNDGIITNSYSNGKIEGMPITYSYYGGLVGSNSNYGKITDCYSTMDVSGGYYVGGLAGYNYGTIISSHSTGNVDGGTAGGLVGGNAKITYIDSSGVIGNSFSITGTVRGSLNVGGLVGDNGTDGTISGCYSERSISFEHAEGTVTAGGLVGENIGTITDSYSMGSITGEVVEPLYGSYTYVGGLAGRSHGAITNSYSTTFVEVTGNTDNPDAHIYIGGLVSDGYSEANSSFWDIDISNVSTSATGEGKSTSDMKTQSTFNEWDFDEIWAIDPTINSGYPYLRAIQPLPSNPSPDATQPVAAPVLAKSRAGQFTIGPNPVTSTGSLNLYWNGGAIKSGNLSVFSSSGSLVSKINIKGVDNLAKSNSSTSSVNLNRQIGSWNLTDRRFRKLSPGSYLLRGVIVLDDGSKERVSLIIGIR